MDWDIYIVEVVPADGWGETYFYCYHNLENARAKIKEIADTNNMHLYNPDFASRYGEFDRQHCIQAVKLSEELFED